VSVLVERRVFLNTAILGFGEVVGQLANFAFVVLLTRRFGVEVLGWYAFAMALGAILAPFVSLGGVAYVTRELARDSTQAGSFFKVLRPLQFASGLAVWLVMATTALLLGVDPREMWIIVMIGAYHVLMRMTALYLAPAAARQRMYSVAVVGGGHRVLVLILASLAMLKGLDAPLVVLAMPVAAGLAFLMARTSARLFTRDQPEASVGVSRSTLVRASLPFLGGALIAVVYQRGGLLLLTFMEGEVATGLYAAADRLFLPIAMITGTFATAVFPAFARLVSEPGQMQVLARRSVRLLLTATIPLAALLAFFATEVTTLVFGAGLAGAAPVILVLAPLPVLRTLSMLWLAQCTALGRERRAVAARSKALVLFFLLALILINYLGAIGLAIAKVLGECYLVWALGRLLADPSQKVAAWRAVRVPLVAGAVAALCLLGMGGWAPGLPLLIRLAVVAGVMILVTMVLGGIRSHDLRFIATILRGGEGWHGNRETRQAPP